MFGNYKFKIEYKVNGVSCVSDKTESDDYVVKGNASDGALTLSIVPKKKMELVKTSLIYDYKYADGAKVFVNGYQSWTVSREYRKDDIQKGLVGAGRLPGLKEFIRLFGDYHFAEYSKNTGFFHSFTYGYVKKEGEIRLFGSLSERQGYTIIYYDMNNNTLSFVKDVEGVTIDKEYALYDLIYVDGDEQTVFDIYFAKMNIKPPKMDFMCGYTSWYNYFGKISEKQILRDLDSLYTKVGKKANIFQIDDGYQSAVGDWTSTKSTFPNGMKPVADEIHKKGYKAGIWLAPFFVQHDAKVKEHTDWLIKNKNGKPMAGAFNWGGFTYVLDIYVREAADYIRNFFNVILKDWGFDMVKLDFLYSSCIEPRYNKSRGQIMCESMDFLRECCGDKLILGCGVPLGPSFGKVDFCRISCDVELSYLDKFYVKHTNQEIVSCKNAMNNSIFRRHLSGRAFGNDPDVFFLRENELAGKDPYVTKKNRLVFTDKQKELLATVNNMFGKVLFVSDNVGGYGEKETAVLNMAFTPTARKVLEAEYVSADEIAIDYMEGEKIYRLTFNVYTGENSTISL